VQTKEEKRGIGKERYREKGREKTKPGILNISDSERKGILT
jgi:hypothetical protein